MKKEKEVTHMRILRNFSLLGLMVLGWLYTAPIGAKADTCGSCNCTGKCETYSCGTFKTCCRCL